MTVHCNKGPATQKISFVLQTFSAFSTCDDTSLVKGSNPLDLRIMALSAGPRFSSAIGAHGFRRQGHYLSDGELGGGIALASVFFFGICTYCRDELEVMSCFISCPGWPFVNFELNERNTFRGRSLNTMKGRPIIVCRMGGASLGMIGGARQSCSKGCGMVIVLLLASLCCTYLPITQRISLFEPPLPSLDYCLLSIVAGSLRFYRGSSSSSSSSSPPLLFLCLGDLSPPRT